MDYSRHTALMTRLRELHALYMEWHRKGMDALRNGDMNALDAAIRAEGAIIEEQRQIVAELQVFAR